MQVHDYWRDVRRPLDLLTIKRKFILGKYSHVDQFRDDMESMFNSALGYFNDQDEIIERVAALKEQFKV
jgi:hypothetical protein